MRGIRKKAILTAAIAAALVGAGTGTALADPPSGTTPALTDIVGVGSDTLTPLFAGSPTENSAGAFQADYNATSPANKLWSWDAVNPSTGNPGDTIVTKGSSASDTTCSTTRPNGSGAGITELEKNTMDGGDYCVDYARSSRAPASTDPSTIAFVALAKDAIAWASPAATASTPSPVPATLTFAQLQAIYTCADTNWDQVGGSNAPIVPVIPQNGSGTRRAGHDRDRHPQHAAGAAGLQPVRVLPRLGQHSRAHRRGRPDPAAVRNSQGSADGGLRARALRLTGTGTDRRAPATAVARNRNNQGPGYRLG